ncbi:MAG TPA: hypothetical protein VGB25_10650 [Candidatus Binatia bacterium]
MMEKKPAALHGRALPRIILKKRPLWKAFAAPSSFRSRGADLAKESKSW